MTLLPSLQLGHVRRWALVLILVAAFVLQAAPASAGTARLSVEKTGTGHEKATVSDDLGMINCGLVCDGSFEQYCETDPDFNFTMCEPQDVVLTTTVPVGFAFSWTGCSPTDGKPAECITTMGVTQDINTLTNVGISYTDVQNPSVLLEAPANESTHRSNFLATASATDNDQVARVDFKLVPKSGSGSGITLSDSTPSPFAVTFGVSTLADGEYTLTAQSIDRSGRTSGLSARDVWIDKTPPNLEVAGPGSATAPGPWLAAGQDLDWTITATDDLTGMGTLMCADDGSSFGGCATLTSHRLPAYEGPHSMSVRARDKVGNETIKTLYYQGDATAPAVEVTGPEDGAKTNNTAPSFGVTSSDGESGVASVTCQLDGGLAAACGESFQTQGLAEGTHTITVVATNAAGMTTTVTRSFTVDPTPPRTKITAGPARPWSLSTAASFGLGSDDGSATYKCKLDSGVFATCATPKKHTALAAGTHRFSTRAADALGNVDPTPASWTWTVPHDERILSFGKAWSGLTKSVYWQSTALKTKTQGATLARKDVRARRLAIVATTCSACGTIDVFHGTTRVKRVNLSSATTKHRHIFTVKTYTKLSSAKNLRIVVVTKGKPVAIDGVGIATR